MFGFVGACGVVPSINKPLSLRFGHLPFTNKIHLSSSSLIDKLFAWGEVSRKSDQKRRQCVRALQGPCHRARCSKASHRPGPKNSLRFAALLPTHTPCIPVPVLVTVLIQSSIVHAILQRGLGATFATLSPHELAWCCVIVELPHHKGGLGITPLPASGMAAFYSATVHLVSWLGSLPCLRMGCW